jgi:hypothetical protein
MICSAKVNFIVRSKVTLIAMMSREWQMRTLYFELPLAILTSL